MREIQGGTPRINLNLSPDQMIPKSSSNTILQSSQNGKGRKIDEVLLNRVLIVEDENKLLGHLVRIISDEGFSTFTCTSFPELENILKIPIRKFDIIVLDRLLHGKDTATLVGRIKEVLPDIKILIVSAVNTPAEKAALLDFGADDYLAKPFDSDELVARVRALLRRNRSELRLGNVTLDSDKRTVKINALELALQNKEFILLRTLIRSPGKVFNKVFLYENVWEMSPDVESNVVEATVNKLRRRLEEADANISIKSMRNKGYWVEE